MKSLKALIAIFAVATGLGAACVVGWRSTLAGTNTGSIATTQEGGIP